MQAMSDLAPLRRPSPPIEPAHGVAHAPAALDEMEIKAPPPARRRRRGGASRERCPVQASMLAMDRENRSSFRAWVRSQANVHAIASHVARLAPEYAPARTVRTLRWLFVDWKLSSIVTVVGAISERLVAGGAGGPAATVQIVAGLVNEWESLHIAQLIVLLYGDHVAAATPASPEAAIVGGLLGAFERRAALLIMAHMERILRVSPRHCNKRPPHGVLCVDNKDAL